MAFFLGKALGRESRTDRMKQKIDSDRGRRMISWRFATVEPVFGNTRNNKRQAEKNSATGIGAAWNGVFLRRRWQA